VGKCICVCVCVCVCVCACSCVFLRGRSICQTRERSPDVLRYVNRRHSKASTQREVIVGQETVVPVPGSERICEAVRVTNGVLRRLFQMVGNEEPGRIWQRIDTLNQNSENAVVAGAYQFL
jgi:hypothetical protein